MTAVVSRPQGFVPQLTRAWVNLYCTGMSAESRAIRRLEIESDLWEHFADRAAHRVSPAAIGVEALGRLLRGVPSDIAWRFQAEGFHMNIDFPLERLAGLLLLVLIVPFIAGISIAGYDFSRDSWPSEFQRFSDISSRARAVTAALHAGAGLALIAAATQLFASLRERSPRLVSLGFGLLLAGGIVMLVNAAVYDAMSSLAEDYRATQDPALAATARSFGRALSALAAVNLGTLTVGVMAMSLAMTRLAMVPRWTMALSATGLAGAVMLFTLGPLADGLAWAASGVALLCVVLWLLICGIWLLFGGSAKYPPMSTEAPA